MSLGIKDGGEVVMPNRTLITTGHALLIIGAKPILVDVLPDQPVMDTCGTQKKVTSSTRAIMPISM